MKVLDLPLPASDEVLIVNHDDGVIKVTEFNAIDNEFECKLKQNKLDRSVLKIHIKLCAR